MMLERSNVRTQRWDAIPKATGGVDDSPVEMIMSVRDKQARDIVAYFYGVGSQEDMNCAVLQLMSDDEVESCFGDIDDKRNFESLIRFVKAISQAYKYDQLFPNVLSRVFEKHHKALHELEGACYG